MVKIAIAGVRGIPVIYSGFETLAENLAIRLVERGWEVQVFCRNSYVEYEGDDYKGVELVRLPSIKMKQLDTLSHSFLASLYVGLFSDAEIVLFLGLGSGIFSLLVKLFGKKSIVHVDGFDWRREKWGSLARWYFKLSQWFTVKFADLVLTDSVLIEEYYEDNFGMKIENISYGFDFYEGKKIDYSVLEDYGLSKGGYFVWSGRLVPDNHAHELLEAYKSLEGKEVDLVIVGGSSFANSYEKKLKKIARNESGIKFLGFLERDRYLPVIKSSRAYIETKRSGGTHPSLVEAMGMGCLVVANDYCSTKDTVGKEGELFYKAGDIDSLKKVMKRVIDVGEFEGELKRLQERARKKYSWSVKIEEYEEMFSKLI